MRTKRTMLEPGTISCGTLRAEDVIPALADALRTVAPRHPLLKETDGKEEPDSFHTEDCDDLWIDLLDALQEYAPPGYYVGALEGDGADIGVWNDGEEEEDEG
jgi:hypothetical protein